MVAWMRWIHEMATGKAWIQGPLEHGKGICSSFKSNEVIKIKSNRKSRNKFEKFSKKESSEIQDVTAFHGIGSSAARGKWGRRSLGCGRGARGGRCCDGGHVIVDNARD